jgi:catechol-2,3-dioxygenase
VGVDEGFTPATKAHPALLVDSRHDLDALAERLTLAGAPVHWDDGRFYTEDPWGNRLELTTADAHPRPAR